MDEKERPLVSVVIPTYNRPDMLYRALQSVLSQTYQFFEIIVINDAGDEEPKLIEQMRGHPQIKYYRREQNAGSSAARNMAINDFAVGKYVAYLDDDDFWYPNHLEILLNELENTEYHVAYSNAYKAYQQKMSNGHYETVRKVLEYSYSFDKNALLVQNYIPTTCMMHERQLAIDVGLFDETIDVYEDWDLWIRLSRQYDFLHIPVVTGEFTFRDDGTSKSSILDFRGPIPVIYNRYSHYANDDVRKQQQQLLMQLEGQKRMQVLSTIYNQENLDAAVSANWHGIDGFFMQVLASNIEARRNDIKQKQAELERFKDIETLVAKKNADIASRNHPLELDMSTVSRRN